MPLPSSLPGNTFPDLIAHAYWRFGASSRRMSVLVRRSGWWMLSEPEAGLDTQAVIVRRSVAGVNVEDLVVLDVTVVWEPTPQSGTAYRPTCLVVDVRAGLVDRLFSSVRRWHTCTHSPHATQVDCPMPWSVEHDLGAVPAECHADDVVGLHLAAGADAQVAVDAGVEVHGDGRMRAVATGRSPLG